MPRVTQIHENTIPFIRAASMPFVGQTSNILLQPRSNFSLLIEATLEYKRDSKVVKLIVKDGAGSIDWATLPAGGYLILFEVRPTHYEFEKDTKLPAPLWAGKGVTKSIGFKVNSR